MDKNTDLDIDTLLEDEREAQLERHRQEQEQDWHAGELRRELGRGEAAMEEYRARMAEEWDDWAMWDAMYPEARGRKRRVVQVELSSGSGDEPRVAKILRIPLQPHGPTRLAMTVDIEEDVVFEDVATSPAGSEPGAALEGHGGPSGRAGEVRDPSEVSTVPLDSLMHRAVLAEGGSNDIPVDLDLDKYQAVYQRRREGSLSDQDVLVQVGQSALELMQNQFIVSMEDTEDTAALLGGGIGSDPVREQDVSRNRPEGS